MTRPLSFAEIYDACVHAGACPEGLAWLREQSHYADFVQHPDYAFWAACYVPGADVAALQAVVLASGGAQWCYYFARFVPGADVAALQAAVLASGDAKWCYWFAQDVPGAEVAALGAAVLASGDAWWCHHFARNVPGADIAALRRVS
jgi:hypothetical protein